MSDSFASFESREPIIGLVDWDGDDHIPWGNFSRKGIALPIRTPAFPWSPQFGEAILTQLREWFKEFNLEITTERGNKDLSPGKALICIVGGTGTNWWNTDPATGLPLDRRSVTWNNGVAVMDGFFPNPDGQPKNMAYCFSGNYTSFFASLISYTIAHEWGHLCGLDHARKIVNGQVIGEYDDGDGVTAPIMGVIPQGCKGYWRPSDREKLGAALGWKVDPNPPTPPPIPPPTPIPVPPTPPVIDVSKYLPTEADVKFAFDSNSGKILTDLRSAVTQRTNR